MKETALECLFSIRNFVISNYSKPLVIIGVGFGGLYLVGKVHCSYKKSQRRWFGIYLAICLVLPVFCHLMQEEMGLCWEKHGCDPWVSSGKICTKFLPFPPEIGDLYENDWNSLWSIFISFPLQFRVNSGCFCHVDRLILKSQRALKGKHPGSHLMEKKLQIPNFVWNYWQENSTRTVVLTCLLKIVLLPELSKSWPRSTCIGGFKIFCCNLNLSSESCLILCRVLVLWRWVHTKGKSFNIIQANMPFIFYFIKPLILRTIKQQAYGQGMGRHTEGEVIEMGVKNLRAISAFLGNIETHA